MNYGLYLSASGVFTNLYRQDVFANNLANLGTHGFKADLANLKQRAPEAIEDPHLLEFADGLLDKLGGGTLAGPQTIDFTPGPLEQTGNPLDVALVDRNAFFSVRHTDPVTGENALQLTRAGNFTFNNEGELVLPNGGKVLGPDDEPIQLDNTTGVNLTADGGLWQDGALVGRLNVSSVADPQSLVKQGENLYAMPRDTRLPLDQPHLKPGFLEASGVNPIDMLNKMITAGRSAQGNANMMKYHDRLMDQAVNVLGRVA